MTGVGNGINADVGIFVADGLVTGFDGYADVLILGIDNCLRVLIMGILRALLKDSNMEKMIM